MSYVRWFNSLCVRAGLLLLISAMVLIPAGPCSHAAEAEENVVVLDDIKKEEKVPEQEEEKSTEPEEEEEGLSTAEWIGIGVGAVAVIGGVVALAGSGGGSSSSGTTTSAYPSKSDVVGAWYATGTRVIGESATYTGTYTFYNNGKHKYDLYVSDGRHKVNTGTWVLVKNSLKLWNNSGSVYKGTFKSGNYSRIDIVTTDGRWKTTLKKTGN